MKGVKISQPISISPRAIWHPQPPQLPEVYLSAIYMYLAFDGSYVRNDYVRGVEDAINNFLSDGGENLMLAVLIDYPSGFDVSAKLIVKLRDSSGHLHIRVLTKNEINMGDPNTLVNFITEANNIAEDLIGRSIIVTRSVLYINGHGGEIMGTAQDWTPSDFLTPKELRQALQNTMHFNIIYLHSCYEGFFEMAYDLRDLADYMIGSPVNIIMWRTRDETRRNFERWILNQTLFKKWSNNIISTREYAIAICPMISATYSAQPIVQVLYLRSDYNLNGINDLEEIKEYLDNLANRILTNWNTYKNIIKEKYNSIEKIRMDKISVENENTHQKEEVPIMHYAKIISIFDVLWPEKTQIISNLINAVVVFESDSNIPSLAIFMPKYFGDAIKDKYNLFGPQADVYINNGEKYSSFLEKTYWDSLIAKIRNFFKQQQNNFVVYFATFRQRLIALVYTICLKDLRLY